MKASQILTLLGFASLSVAQSPAPSPTESYGCEPHGDHGARATTEAVTGATVSTTVAAATTSAAGDHDHDDDHDDHDHDHDDASGTGSLPPSPTASIGCHPHGDHWHCDGPASTAAGDASATVATTTPAATTGSDGAQATTTEVPSGAARAGFGVAAAVVAALMAF